MSRQDLARGTLRVEGRDCGGFTKKTGGGNSSPDGKVRPAGGEEEVIVGGPATRENITLTGQQTHDKIDLIHWLDSRVGRGSNDQCVYSETPLDGDGNAFHPPKSWRGALVKVTWSDRDSSSDGERAEFTVEIATAGPVA